MKLAVAIFALVALVGVRGSNPKINNTWVQGASNVDAPITESAASGKQVKEDLISAVNNYLIKLDLEFSRLFGTWAYDVQSKCSRNHKEIEDKKIHIQIGGDADFTNQLAALANEYYSISRGINGTRRLGQRQIEGVGADSHKISDSQANAGLPRYTMEELFFSYQRIILERDFQTLREFLFDLLGAGYRNVRWNAQRMEKNHRLDNLWPLVETLQRQSHSLENDYEILKTHSSSAVFREYIESRNELWAINVAQKIYEDQH